MMRFPLRSALPLPAMLSALPLLLTGLVLPMPAMSAAATEHAIPRYKTNLPPSADLLYSIKARQSGLDIAGKSTIQWQASSGRYSIVVETRAMLVGKILDEKSEGAIDEHGLAPVTFTEKRFRKNATTATFNRQTRTISFTDSGHTYPIRGGEQDRISVTWQLIAVARAAPAKFKPGSAWTFFVAGQQDAEPWTFKVGEKEKISTSMGEMDALHVTRDPGPDAKRRLDIWLAPSLGWYPVRLRFREGDGDYIEQVLEEISRR